MKFNAQSLMEFSIILLIVTIVSFVSLKIISNNINSAPRRAAFDNVTNEDDSVSAEEQNCIKMGLYWDKQNGICEAR